MIQEISEDTDIAWMNSSTVWKEDDPDSWMGKSTSSEEK